MARILARIPSNILSLSSGAIGDTAAARPFWTASLCLILSTHLSMAGKGEVLMSINQATWTHAKLAMSAMEYRPPAR